MNVTAQRMTRPLVTSAALSVLLHGIVIAIFLLVQEPVTIIGKGLEVELVRSNAVTDLALTDLAVAEMKQNDVSNQVETEQTDDENTPKNTNLAVTDNHEREDISLLKSKGGQKLDLKDGQKLELKKDRQKRDQKKAPDEANNYTQALNSITSVSTPALSTASSSTLSSSTPRSSIQQQESIVELLHSSISDKKEYPYIARRQRREGVATIGFVLHPNGTIENTHLVLSSNVSVLDRAALSAVKDIAPFKPAQQYLEQAEAFKVDVVFSLL